MNPRPDVLFGQIGVDLGLLERPEVDTYLERQRTASSWSSLGVLLLQAGRQDEEQVHRILEEQARRREAQGTPTSDLFGKLIVRMGFVAEAELRQVVADQELFRTRGYDFRLGQLLQNKGLLTPADLDRVLSIQQKRILVCPRCLIAYNFSFGEDAAWQNCRGCGGHLVRPQFEA